MSAQSNKGYTPLILATSNGQKEIVLFLLLKGVDVNARDSNGLTALNWAQNQEQTELAELLNVNTGAIEVIESISQTKLYQALLNGKNDVAIGLISNSSDVNAVNAMDAKGWTALMYAPYEGHFAIVDFLIEYGANVNAQSNNGYTALILAAAGGKKDIVLFLFLKKVDTNTQDSEGRTTLNWATYEGHVQIAVISK